MKPQKNYDTLHHLKSLCTNRMSFDTKLFMFSISKTPYPVIVQVLILCIEYAQLLAQTILLNNYFSNTAQYEFNTLYTTIAPIAKVFIPGYFYSPIGSNTVPLALLIFLLLYVLAKILLILYVCFVAQKGIKGFPALIFLWRWFFKLHGRILYLFFTSFWVNIAIVASQDDYNPFGFGSSPTMAVAIVIIIVEYIMSVFIYTRYAYLLPTKSFIAAKETSQEVIILTQKFAIQILQIILAGNSLTNSIIFATITLVWSLGNVAYYFRVLPMYNIKALILESGLIMEGTMLNILFLIRHVINKAEGIRVTMDTPILLGIVLTPCVWKLSYTYVNRAIVNLVANVKEDSPYILMHKIMAVKQIRQQQNPPTEYSKTYEWRYLIHSSYRAKISSVFGLDEEANDLKEIDSKETSNRIFVAYLERLSQQFPKNTLIKLYLAYYYGKKIKAYGTAVKILFGLQQSSSSKIAICASLLIYETQKTLMREYESNKSQLNMATYISSLAAITELKEKILEQTDIQIKICKEFAENAPDLAKIFNFSQKVGVLRSNLEKKMKLVLEDLPEYNLEPQVLFGRYHLVLNHSIMDYLRHAKTFTKLCQRYAKQLSDNNLCQETLFLRDNVFLMITTQTGSSGIVTYCSKSAEKIYGSNLAGSLAYSIAPPVLQNFFFEFFRNPLDKKNLELFGNIFRTFGYQRSGHLVETDFYINIHPFLSQGLFYNLIIRPVKSNKDFIIINDVGGIEAFTKDVGDKLGLTPPTDANLRGSVNISQVSVDLARISDAASMVAAREVVRSSRSKGDMNKAIKTDGDDFVPHEMGEDQVALDAEEAQNLYTVFNTEGKQLDLSPANPFKARGGSFTYHCKIENQYYGSTYLKVITLEESEFDDEIFAQAKTLIWKSTGLAKEGVNNVPSKEVDNAKEKHLPQQRDMDKKDTLSPGQRRYSMVASDFSYRDDNALETQGSNMRDSCLPVGEEHPMPVNLNNYQPSMELPTASARRVSMMKDLRPGDSKIKSDSSKIMNASQDRNNLKVAMEEKWDQDEKNAVAKLEIAQQSLGSQKSRSSAQGRVSKALHEAMSLNYSPRYYNVFILGFYCLLFGIFGCQLGLKLTLDTDINGRIEEKNMIRSSETRNDLLASTQRILRYIQDVDSGRLTTAQLGLVGKTVPGYIDAGITNLENLAQLNNELIQATNGLSAEFRDELFSANVKVYYTNFGESPEVYTYLNNFQATERIIETGMKGLEIAATDVPTANTYFTFIYRNALNDFLIKCDEISDIFLESLDQEEQTTLNKLTYILSGTMVVFAFIIIITAVVVAMQYDMEKKNMVAFIKLSPPRVREVLEGILQFKRVIQEDSNFEEVSQGDIAKFMKNANAKHESGSKKNKQSYVVQHFNIRGIFRKYMMYLLNLIVLMLIMGGFTGLIYYIATSKIESLHMQLHQIQYSDRLSARTNLAVYISQELLTNGNTTLIRDLPPPVEIETAIDDIEVLRRELGYAFDAPGTTYNSIVQGIIYDDACQYLTGMYLASCEVAEQGTGQYSLMAAASALENGLRNRRDLYANSNQTIDVMTAIQLATFNQTVYPNNVLNSATTVISDLIESYYENDIITTRKLSDTIFGVSCGMLVVVGLLAWLSILKKIREADGKFKKVLQTLPPNLILSNFVLKSYLLKTSGGALDFVRNDI